MYNAVLVPLDGSELAEGAMPTARALATRFGATVHTVTVAGSDFEWQRIRAKPPRRSAPTPRTHASTSSSTPTSPVPCNAAPRGSTPAWCVCRPTGGGASWARWWLDRRDIIERGGAPVVVAGPFVVRSDPEDRALTAPLAVDHLVACVDGTPTSERGLAVAAAWAHALGMKLTMVTVAEPCPPPVRIGAPWRRHHGPNEDADEYVRRLGERVGARSTGPRDRCSSTTRSAPRRA